MTRLLVADDHPAFRRGLELLWADVDDIEIVQAIRAAAAGEAITSTVH